MYKRILLTYDGSEAGQKALLDSVDIAQWSHADLHLIAVMPSTAPVVAAEGIVYDPGFDDELKRKYQSVLEDGLKRLAAAGQSTHGEVLVGDTVDVITSHAKKIGADLIVVGHKHLDSWAARWWRGSRSPALIEHAPCSVLVAITQ